jgi:hypothetical protein
LSKHACKGGALAKIKKIYILLCFIILVYLDKGENNGRECLAT